ncbi:uncharacterized protein LOC122663002 [Telopea speciosissima]|uniref:uncharacterized protein LOC122663002 n=1 Tax=Telopea speciosissima TaxID=54955 RepID=UPI001CC6F78F|nr:uncharacterized protein LOC122663002 [Telopea speciosissima]
MKLTKLFFGLDNKGTLFELDFKIEIIFASLPDAYSSFIMNFHMNKVVVNNVSELTNMLIEAESTLKKNKVVSLVTEKSSQGSKNKKKKRTKKSKKSKSTGVKEGGVQKKTAKADKGKCFHCGKTGHWKRIYQEYLASLKKDKPETGIFKSFVVSESLMLVGPTNMWCGLWVHHTHL